MKLDYLVPLRNAVVSPLQKGLDGVREAVEFMKDYNLLREDVDSLIELCQWARGENPFKNVETKVCHTCYSVMYEWKRSTQLVTIRVMADVAPWNN